MMKSGIVPAGNSRIGISQALSGLALFCAMLAFAAPDKSLAPRYREWLNHDVTYIITSEEKQAFLNLPSDRDRDNFIDQFWELRNPTPGSPTNPYKDEIYQRIAYAKQWFGHEGGTEGWRTDRGRVYITLGPPQQRAHQVGYGNVRDMEIWFYSGSHPALPPFFYVVFYVRETGAEYRLYSPYMDGPEKLVTGASATEGNRVAAWKVIDQAEGREVSRTILSLIPDEPVDIDNATTSLQSDVMLATIRGLANNPFTKKMLEERRQLLEAVSHRVILGSEFLDVLTTPLMDRQGEISLHYVLRLKRPEDFSIAQAADGKYYFNAAVVARVSNPKGKVIFSQERKISKYLDTGRLEQVKDKVFGYEGILPLPPGQYKIEFLLSDEIKNTVFRETRDVVVPQRPASGMLLSDVVPFSDAEVQPVERNQPFSAARVKFTPLMGKGISVVAGRDFNFFYQIWTPPADPNSYGDAKLDVEYAYGRLGRHDTKTVHDELLKRQFDPTGTLINGKKIPTADLPIGDYRLMITVSDPETRQKAFTSLSFRVVNSGETSAWDISDEDSAVKEVPAGDAEYQRSLCYLAMGSPQPALAWLQRAYAKNPSDELIRASLVERLYAGQAFDQIVRLYRDGAVTPNTDEQTILRMAESLDKLGQVDKSIQLLEAALPSRQSSTLYLALANYYQQVGNAQKASEMERRGRTLAAPAPQS